MNTKASSRTIEAYSYLNRFKIAQMNLNQLIWEERVRKRLERSKERA